MADTANITANISDTASITGNSVSNATITSSVTTSTSMTGSITTGGSVTQDLSNYVTLTGTQTLLNKTTTGLKMDGIQDTGGVKILEMTPNASGVNYFTVRAGSTGQSALISAESVVDTDVYLNLQSQGGGTVRANGVDVVTAGAWQTWTPTFTGFSADPTGGIYNYRYVGNEVEIEIREPNNGTSNAADFYITLPVAAATITDMEWMGYANGVNNSAFVNTPCPAVIASAGTSLRLYISPNRSTSWGTANGKRCSYLRMSYRWQ